MRTRLVLYKPDSHMIVRSYSYHGIIMPWYDQSNYESQPDKPVYSCTGSLCAVRVPELA